MGHAAGKKESRRFASLAHTYTCVLITKNPFALLLETKSSMADQLTMAAAIVSD